MKIFIGYVGYRKIPYSAIFGCYNVDISIWYRNFDVAIENCNIDGSCIGVFEIDDECDGEGKVIKCSSGPSYGSVKVNAKCGGYIKLGKSPAVYIYRTIYIYINVYLL